MAEPTYKWRPNFQPGEEPCTIQTFNETRSRLLGGSAFFRSKDVGAQWNSITLQIIQDVSPYTNFNNPTPPALSGTQIELTVIHTYSNYSNYYYAQQGADDGGAVNPTPPPATLPPTTCTVSAKSLLRAQITSDSLSIITMPTDDAQQSYDASIAEDITQTATACKITQFGPTPMAGGSSGPPGAIGVRTGPQRAIISINQSEINSPEGVMQDVQELREFNGEFWIKST